MEIFYYFEGAQYSTSARSVECFDFNSDEGTLIITFRDGSVETVKNVERVTKGNEEAKK